MNTLFPITYPERLIARDGEVLHFGQILSAETAIKWMQELTENVAWKRDEAIIFGKRIQTRRKVAWYGDRNYEYHYSGHSKKALQWTQQLLKLKELAEQHSGAAFNSCLLNLYHNGNEGVGWHSDDEPCLGKNPVIATISLGAARRFDLKHKREGTKVSVELIPGSLLVMQGATQHHWVHCIPKSKKVSSPRISLTFRWMHEPEPDQ